VALLESVGSEKEMVVGEKKEDIQEMEKAASKGGDHRRRNGG